MFRKRGKGDQKQSFSQKGGKGEPPSTSHSFLDVAGKGKEGKEEHWNLIT